MDRTRVELACLSLLLSPSPAMLPSSLPISEQHYCFISGLLSLKSLPDPPSVLGNELTNVSEHIRGHEIALPGLLLIYSF